MNSVTCSSKKKSLVLRVALFEFLKKKNQESKNIYITEFSKRLNEITCKILVTCLEPDNQCGSTNDIFFWAVHNHRYA